MRSVRRSTCALVISALVVLSLVGWLAWRSAVLSDRGGDPVLAEDLVLGTSARAPDEDLLRDPMADLAPPEVERYAAPRSGAELSAAPNRTNLLAMRVHFHTPNGAPLELPDAVVRVQIPPGADLTAAVHASRWVQFADLAPVACTLRVEAPGFVHRAQAVDLSLRAGRNQEPNGLVVRTERTVLWPSDWLGVVVETTDGRSVLALARELGMTQEQLFRGAFELHARDLKSSTTSGLASTARFFEPPGTYAQAGNVIGSLQLFGPPPMRVELRVFGIPAGEQDIAVGQTELLFRIDRSLLSRSLAQVAFRVVDPTGGAPIRGARASLQPQPAARRNKPRHSAVSEFDGRISFANLLPGRYQLDVERAGTRFQEMLELGNGEARDLGDIPVGKASPFELQVVDEAGNPIFAHLETAPYERGASTRDLFLPQVHLRTDATGRATMAASWRPVILRASARQERWGGSQELQGARSANVLLDPARTVSQAPLQLVLRRPISVQFVIDPRKEARVQVLDELELVVAQSEPGFFGALTAQLVAGAYRVRASLPDGTLWREQAFTVAGEPLVLPLD